MSELKRIPIPDRFSAAIGDLYRAQRRAERSGQDEDRVEAQAIARKILADVSEKEAHAFSAAIQEELAVALRLGCPTRAELKEAADTLQRSLEHTDPESTRLGPRAAQLAHASLLLAIANQDGARLRAAIAAGQEGAKRQDSANLPCLIETMMALSFVRQLDPDLLRASVGDSRLFGLAVSNAQRRALGAITNAPPPKLHVANARIHIQYAVYEDNIRFSERSSHAGHAIMALSQLQVESLKELRKDVLLATVIAASAVSVLSIGLAYALKELKETPPTYSEMNPIYEVLSSEDSSPVALTATVRRLLTEYDELARSIADLFPVGLARRSPTLDLNPLLDLLDEYEDHDMVRAMAAGMWKDITATAANAEKHLELS